MTRTLAPDDHAAWAIFSIMMRERRSWEEMASRLSVTVEHLAAWAASYEPPVAVQKRSPILPVPPRRKKTSADMAREFMEWRDRREGKDALDVMRSITAD